MPAGTTGELTSPSPSLFFSFFFCSLPFLDRSFSPAIHPTPHFVFVYTNEEEEEECSVHRTASAGDEDGHSYSWHGQNPFLVSGVLFVTSFGYTSFVRASPRVYVK